MKQLDRYIARNVLSSVMLVTLVLVGLQLFISFVRELDDLGRGHYHIRQVFSVMLLEMPGEVYLFFPVACLIGALIGLGQLASHHELIVMRAAGISMKRIIWAVLKGSLIFIMIVALLGELFAPRLLTKAHQTRWEAIHRGQTMETAHGIWLKNGTDFIVVGEINTSNELNDLKQFHFDDKHQLILARQIKRLSLEQGHWRAYDVKETWFHGDATEVRQLTEVPWELPFDIFSLRVNGKAPDELDFLSLRHYIQSKDQSAMFMYQLAYWQRMMQPLTTLVMMLLAIPFIFGPLRHSTMGAKLLLGISVGFGFYIINRFFGPLAHILHWPPPMAAMVPTMVFAVLGFYTMGRMR